MAGGQTILTGLLLLVVWLVLVTARGAWSPFTHLICGSIPLALIVGGGILILIGATDLKAQRTAGETNAGPGSAG